MFNNLIESSSHKREFKRRGSFFLFTTAAYAVLFMIVGIVSIYAYDANLREQTTEITMLTFVPPAADSEISFHPQRVHTENSSSDNSNSVRPTRPLLIDRPDNPNNVPDRIGVTAPVVPPAPPGTIIGPEIQNPPGSGRSGNGSGEDSDRIAPARAIEVG